MGILCLVGCLAVFSTGKHSRHGITKAGKNESKSVTISPENPTASWSTTLAPGFTATYSVQIEESGEANGTNHSLKSGPTGTFSSPENTIWTPEEAAMNATYSILNTAKIDALATMRVDVVWEPERGEGGEGEGGSGPDDIHGWAKANVDLRKTHVHWHFDREYQWADGQKLVQTWVFASDGHGQGVTSWALSNVKATEASPESPGWNFSAPVQGSSAWIRTSQFASSTPSKGKVEATLTIAPGDERKFDLIEKSAEEIAFIGLELDKVSFNGNKTIKSDNNQLSYGAPHWQREDSEANQEAREFPVAYVSNTNLTFQPEWKLLPEGVSPKIKIKASGPDSITIDEVTARVSGAKVDLANPATATDEFEKDKVRYWESFELNFEASFEEEETWVEAGTSKNQVYGTWGAPDAAVSPLFHTVLHLACSNADGKTAENDILDAVWALFAGRNVKGVDGTNLTYYANYKNGNQSVAQLLASRDGECPPWAILFVHSLWSNGLTIPVTLTAFTMPQNQGFIIKNWSFTGTGTSGNSSYPYFGIPKSDFIGTNQYNWKWTEVDQAEGIGGQNNPSPASFFEVHYVILIDGVYYDPSYGTTYNDPIDFQNKALEGLYRRTTQTVNESDLGENGQDINGNGTVTDTLANVPVIQFKRFTETTTEEFITIQNHPLD